MRRLLLATMLLAALLTGCSDDETSSTTTADAGSGTTADDAATTTSADAIEPEGPFIQDLQFQNLEVEARSAVTVENRDEVTHTFSFVDGGVAVVLQGGTSGSFTAPDAGEYGIFCEIHGSMTATLVVT